MNKGIIFDLDGTLWDSSEQVVYSWNEVLEKQADIKRLITVSDMRSVMGKTLPEIAQILFGYTGRRRSIEIMEACCKEEQSYLEVHGGRLYPDLEQVLKELTEAGYNLFIVSNCQDGYIESFFTYHKLGRYFTDYEDPGRTELGKDENIKLIMERNQLEQAVYVGDTKGDYEAAMKAGIPFIHAAYGFGKVEEAKYRILNLRKLKAAVLEVLGD